MTAGVKSAERALQVLDLLSEREQPLTFAELSSATGVPRSSLHGLLATLVAREWLTVDAERRYWLGIRTWQAGSAYVRATGLVAAARPRMERVRDEVGETVQLAVLDGRHCVYVEKVDGGDVLVLASEVGRRLPAHASGVGKVLLAALPEEELEERLGGVRLERLTKRTLTDLDALRAELRRVGERGWGTDDEEYSVGVRCVAVPVYGAHGRLVAAMSVSAPAVRFGPSQRKAALARLQEAAGSVSYELGGQALARQSYA